MPIQGSIQDSLVNQGAQSLQELIAGKRRQELSGQQQLQQIGAQGQQHQAAQEQAMNLKDMLQGREVERARQLRGEQGEHVGVKIGDTGITPKDTSMVDFRQDKLLQDKAESYSKRLQNLSGFQSALSDIENMTAQKDAKGMPAAGGVVTNPNAKMMGTGKVMSAAPDSMIGIGELVGAVPKGSMESRKAIGRLLVEYKKAIAGMRGTDQLLNQERVNMGMAVSDDPQLAAKAVRAMAKSVAQQLNSVQAGYTPDVKNMVHSSLGQDPSGQFRNIYDDDKPNANPAQAAQSDSMHNLAASAQSPKGQQQQVDAATQAKIKKLQDLRAKAAQGQ